MRAAMRLLLDTHIAIWMVLAPARIAEAVRRAMLDADAVFLSVASAWEAAIKQGKGKLVLPGPLEERALADGLRPLPVAMAHIAALRTLPDHHADPFDRILLAQAVAERLVLVSADPLLWRYEVPLLRA
jgi:PIN domain nuclease of toxin-antitoxin system